jgi:hypothetical protein
MPTHRTLIWIDKLSFLGWGCSECAWAFKPSGPLHGKSLDKMMEAYKRLCDLAFAAHLCVDHLRATKTKGQVVQDASFQ